jgi:peptidoglycan/xylan/chitin deacetylase (PgdA/CDA1 family)
MEATVTAPRLEQWQWPEAHWRKLVNQVRAGRSLCPKGWKNGARCAFALSFDSDHETNELREGGNSIGRMAWGEYGSRVGVPRILKLLQKYGVKASFYVPAVAALLHPEEQRRVIAEGHEIGIHGWIHELNSALPYEAERDLMLRAAGCARPRLAGPHRRAGNSAGAWARRAPTGAPATAATRDRSDARPSPPCTGCCTMGPAHTGDRTHPSRRG